MKKPEPTPVIISWCGMRRPGPFSKLYWRKNFSKGVPWKGDMSSPLVCGESESAVWSILTFTEITAGFTLLIRSAKPTGPDCTWIGAAEAGALNWPDASPPNASAEPMMATEPSSARRRRGRMRRRGVSFVAVMNISPKVLGRGGLDEEVMHNALRGAVGKIKMSCQAC